MAKEQTKLLDLMKSRLHTAKEFTKPFIKEVERCVKDYSLEMTEEEWLAKITNPTARYDFRIPYIQATHESYMAAIFNKAPDIIIRNRGKYDEEKQRKILGAYEYLKDKLDLGMFTQESAHWFVLLGWTSASASFISETEEVDASDPATGEPLIDENGEVIKTVIYKYNDPVVTVGDPTREFYSPESEFSVNGDKIPYKFRYAKMRVEEIKKIYGVTVEPDEEIEIDLEESLKETGDLKRSTVYFYCGHLTEDSAKEVKGVTWDADRLYYVIFTKSKILYSDAINEKPDRYQRWYYIPNKFFGFGLGKTLRESQSELNIRRGQEIKYADLLSHPKLAYQLGSEVDLQAMRDPRLGATIGFKDQPPQYIVPPDISNTIILAEQKAREDAQFISGLLDLNKGAQDAVTVKTATGQSIFANAAERKVERVKQLYFHFYRSMVIYLLKLCRDNWDEEKIVYITDEDGKTETLTLTAEDLKDIDFDADLDIDVENISVNKESLRAQTIEAYQILREEQFMDRKKLAKKLLREVWNEKNPDQYILDNEGMTDQSAQLGLPPKAMGGEIPSSQGGVMGANVQA